MTDGSGGGSGLSMVDQVVVATLHQVVVVLGILWMMQNLHICIISTRFHCHLMEIWIHASSKGQVGGGSISWRRLLAEVMDIQGGGGTTGIESMIVILITASRMGYSDYTVPHKL